MTETTELATPDTQRRALEHLLRSMADDVARLPDPAFGTGSVAGLCEHDRIARQGMDALRSAISGLQTITSGLALDRYRARSDTGVELIRSGLAQLGRNAFLNHLSECATVHEEHTHDDDDSAPAPGPRATGGLPPGHVDGAVGEGRD